MSSVSTCSFQYSYPSPPMSNHLQTPRLQASASTSHLAVKGSDHSLNGHSNSQYKQYGRGSLGLPVDSSAPSLSASAAMSSKSQLQRERAQAQPGAHSQGGGEQSMPQIDLHGFTKREAVNRLTDFLERHEHAPWVCVVTGSGAHSPDGPVIRNAVKKLLSKRKMEFRKLDAGRFMVNASTGIVLYQADQPKDSKVVVVPRDAGSQKPNVFAAAAAPVLDGSLSRQNSASADIIFKPISRKKKAEMEKQLQQSSQRGFESGAGTDGDGFIPVSRRNTAPNLASHSETVSGGRVGRPLSKSTAQTSGRGMRYQSTGVTSSGWGDTGGPGTSTFYPSAGEGIPRPQQAIPSRAASRPMPSMNEISFEGSSVDNSYSDIIKQQQQMKRFQSAPIVPSKSLSGGEKDREKEELELEKAMRLSQEWEERRRKEKLIENELAMKEEELLKRALTMSEHERENERTLREEEERVFRQILEMSKKQVRKEEDDIEVALTLSRASSQRVSNYYNGSSSSPSGGGGEASQTNDEDDPEFREALMRSMENTPAMPVSMKSNNCDEPTPEENFRRVLRMSLLEAEEEKEELNSVMMRFSSDPTTLPVGGRVSQDDRSSFSATKGNVPLSSEDEQVRAVLEASLTDVVGRNDPVSLSTRQEQEDNLPRTEVDPEDARLREAAGVSLRKIEKQNSNDSEYNEIQARLQQRNNPVLNSSHKFSSKRSIQESTEAEQRHTSEFLRSEEFKTKIPRSFEAGQVPGTAISVHEPLPSNAAAPASSANAVAAAERMTARIDSEEARQADTAKAGCCTTF